MQNQIVTTAVNDRVITAVGDTNKNDNDNILMIVIIMIMIILIIVIDDKSNDNIIRVRIISS